MRRMFSEKQIQEIAGNIVKSIVEGGTLDNAKPIYYHPIYFTDNTASKELRLTCAILDNNSEEYKEATFKAKAKELVDNGAIIQINGYFTKESTCYNAYALMKSGESYLIYGNDYQGNRNTISLDGITFASLDDGKNKIN